MITNPELKDLKITGRFPLYAVLDVPQKVRGEFYDYDSFTNLTSKDIRCLWEHHADQQLGSVAEGNLRLWLGDGCLNLELNFDEDNVYSRDMFFNKMKQYSYMGLSPGYKRIKDQEVTDVDGSIKQVIVLNEISLTPRPVHKGSSAILREELSMTKVSEQLEREEAWLEKMKASKAGKIAGEPKFKVVHTIRDGSLFHDVVEQGPNAPSEDPRVIEAWRWLREQQDTKKALANSGLRKMTPAEVATFKKGNPYFERVAQNRGYETAHFSLK
ncbi:hypothetical protein ES702_07187 [subsurface metagenome]